MPIKFVKTYKFQDQYKKSYKGADSNACIIARGKQSKAKKNRMSAKMQTIDSINSRNCDKALKNQRKNMRRKQAILKHNKDIFLTNNNY